MSDEIPNGNGIRQAVLSGQLVVCETCACLVLPDHKSRHDAWHRDETLKLLGTF